MPSQRQSFLQRQRPVRIVLSAGSNRTPFFYLFTTFLACVFFAACSQSPSPSQSGQGDSTEEGEEARNERPWSVRQAAVTASVGAPGTARLQIQAAPGFKINTEFPSRVVASADAEQLTLPQAEVSGILEAKDRLAFAVPFEGRNPGAHQIQLKGDFSICLDDENGYCLLFNQETLALNIQVEGAASAPAAPAAQPTQR